LRFAKWHERPLENARRDCKARKRETGVGGREGGAQKLLRNCEQIMEDCLERLRDEEGLNRPNSAEDRNKEDQDKAIRE